MDALYKHIQTKVNETLLNEVADTVKETESDAVKDVVYGSYHPKVYNRRMDNGGLSDTFNMDEKLESDGIVSITNNALAYPTITIGGKSYDSKNKGKLLTPMVVEGGNDNYDFHGGEWEEPRDFIQATKDSLESSGVHVEALKDGLKRRGVTIK